MLLLFFQQHKCKSKSHLKSINRNNNKKPMQIGRSRRGATLVVAVVGWDGMGWDGMGASSGHGLRSNVV